MSNEDQDKYFKLIWEASGIERKLPFPKAKPLFGNSSEQLANRKAAHEYAKKVLDWNRNRLAMQKN